LAAIGALAVLLASLNFVNLTTARATRRAIEVGVRKASGASRTDLVIQFIGESMIYVALSMVLALALVEVLMPYFNAFLGRTILFATGGVLTSRWHRRGRVVGRDTGRRLSGRSCCRLSHRRGCSGIAPAVLSVRKDAGGSRHPAVRDPDWVDRVDGSSVSTNQFRDARELELDKDQVLLIRGACAKAFKDEVRGLPAYDPRRVHFWRQPSILSLFRLGCTTAESFDS